MNLCKPFLSIFSVVMVHGMVLGQTQLNDDPLPSYCRTGFCTSNKNGISFSDLKVEHNSFPKITQHCPPLTCQHVTQEVKVEHLRRTGGFEGSNEVRGTPMLTVKHLWMSMRAEDWQAWEESCSVIPVVSPQHTRVIAQQIPLQKNFKS